MYFIVVYNRTTGYTDKILSEADPDNAFKLFQDKEDEYQDNKDISVNYLLVTTLSHSPRDRFLWILVNNGGKMERSRLRASTRMRYVLLNPILDELVRKGKIKMTLGKDGDIISLISR